MVARREQVSEAQVAVVVVAYLEALGADVYQEVECGTGVADIVARVRAELWIVEVKTSLSLALLYQAMERRREAHRVIIAAPHTKHGRDVAVLCAELGIGLLEVHPGFPGISVEDYDYGAPAVRVLAESRRWNSRPVALAAQLQPQHKTHAKAGAIGAGGRWTPFRRTCEQLAEVVRAEPGIELKAAVDKTKHHYRSTRSARTALSHWLQIDKVPGVRLAYSNGGCASAPKRARLYPTESR